MNRYQVNNIVRKFGHLDTVDSLCEIFDHFETIRKEVKCTQSIRRIISQVLDAFNPLLSLPPEILTHIFYFLTIHDLFIIRNVFLIHKDLTKSLYTYYPFWKQAYERITGDKITQNYGHLLATLRFYVLESLRQPQFKKNYYDEYKNKNKRVMLLDADVRKSWPSRENSQSFEYLLMTEEPVFSSFFSIHLDSKWSFSQTQGVESVYGKVNNLPLFELGIFSSQNASIKLNSLNSLVCHLEGFRILEEKSSFLGWKDVIPERIGDGDRTFRSIVMKREKSPVLAKILLIIYSLFRVLAGMKKTKKKDITENKVKFGKMNQFWDVQTTISAGGGSGGCELENENVMVKYLGCRKMKLEEFLERKKFFLDQFFLEQWIRKEYQD